jgi:hypothetical protein
VRCASGHGPAARAPGTSALALSNRLWSARFAELMPFSSIQSVQTFDSTGSKSPLPMQWPVPHSVTNSATPRWMARLALSRSSWRWDPA